MDRARREHHVGAPLLGEAAVSGRRLVCRCGCGRAAEFLCTGGSPEGGYRDEPCCRTAAEYLSSAAAELGFAFSRRGIAGRASPGEEPKR
jgi:hypothetical protein